MKIDETRRRYIGQGIISQRNPQFHGMRQLSADELERAGFIVAATAKRGLPVGAFFTPLS